MGRVIAGRYECGELLGRGAMGAVYRARDLQSQREVAVKVQVLEGASAAARFEREGQVAGGLRHSGIVPVHDAGVEGNQGYLVLSLVEAPRTLTEAAAGLAREQRCALLLQVAYALGYAHEQGVIHRDLKPGNVLVDAGGQVRVTDFGLASFRGAERLTRTGTMLGTPGYMAPEQYGLEKRQVGPAADVWALGVLLYELLTDQLPFEAETLVEMTARVAAGRFAPPRDLDPSIGRGLEAVCLRALRQAPEERYPDAGAFAADLERASRGERVGAVSGGRPSLWVAAAIAPALLLGAAIALPLSAPSPGASTVVEPRMRERGVERVRPRPAARFGWDVRVGQVLPPKQFRWFYERSRSGQVEMRFDLCLLVQERVTLATQERLALSLTILAVRLEMTELGLGNLGFDTADGLGDDGLRTAELVGKAFAVQLRPRTGEVTNVFGLGELKKAAVRGADPVSRETLGRGVAMLNDEDVRQLLGLLHGPIGAAEEPKTIPWRIPISFFAGKTELTGASRLRRRDDSVVGQIEGKARLVLPQQGKPVFVIRRWVEQRATFRGGWMRDSALRLDFQRTARQEPGPTEGELEIRYGEPGGFWR